MPLVCGPLAAADVSPLAVATGSKHRSGRAPAHASQTQEGRKDYGLTVNNKLETEKTARRARVHRRYGHMVSRIPLLYVSMIRNVRSSCPTENTSGAAICSGRLRCRLMSALTEKLDKAVPTRKSLLRRRR